MEVREYALHVVTEPSLAAKLAAAPAGLTDETPAAAVCPAAPGRPAELEIVTDPRAKKKIPRVEGLPDPAQRRRILHGFANHELQAIELFAWALLRFPDVPAAFRRGLLRILGEEQDHCQSYLTRLEREGGRFGELPVTGYLWHRLAALDTPVRFVCAVGLTFENANLDHALDYAAAARTMADPELAAIFQKIHDDEVGHVRFAWHWLERFRDPASSATEAYLDAVTWPLRPSLARGRNFHRQSRERAGLPEEFIRLLESA